VAHVYEFIAAEKTTYPVRLLCRLPGVGHSAFYACCAPAGSGPPTGTATTRRAPPSPTKPGRALPRLWRPSADHRARHRQRGMDIIIYQRWSGGRAAAPVLFADRIRRTTLRRVSIGELLRVGVGVRLSASRSGPEPCECGSGCATSGPPIAHELGKRETGCGGARTALAEYLLSVKSKAVPRPTACRARCGVPSRGRFRGLTGGSGRAVYARVGPAARVVSNQSALCCF
jgi:hypothetical protein